jgi:hypothetical protein
VTNCVLYPSLAVATMGDALRPMMKKAITSNLALCAGVALLFGGVWLALPGTTWLTLIAAAALMTALHLALFGGRYEVSIAGRVHDALFAAGRRLVRRGGA